MFYGYLEERTHGEQRSLFVEGTKRQTGSFGSYAHSIFKRLLIHDRLPDTDIDRATNELLETLAIEDPAFTFGFTDEFKQFIKHESNAGKWRKIRQDALQSIRAEVKRRNIENPYHTNTPANAESWDGIPVPDRAYKNKPWQFDLLYRDINFLALKIKELCAEYSKDHPGDSDIFRLKANILLVADKIIFALDAGNNRGSFLEESTNIIDSKLTLDGFRLADIFLKRAKESLQKIHLIGNGKNSDSPLALIQFSEELQNTLEQRIAAIERRLILFMRIEKDHY